MAEFTAAIRTRLVNNTAVRAVVGQKVHWNIVPAGTSLPYIRLQVVSDLEETDIKGALMPRDVRIQIDCYAEAYGAARDLALKVKDALRVPALVSGVQFGRGLFAGPRDSGEDLATAFIHLASLDAAIWVK